MVKLNGSANRIYTLACRYCQKEKGGVPHGQKRQGNIGSVISVYVLFLNQHLYTLAGLLLLGLAQRGRQIICKFRLFSVPQYICPVLWGGYFSDNLQKVCSRKPSLALS